MAKNPGNTIEAHDRDTQGSSFSATAGSGVKTSSPRPGEPFSRAAEKPGKYSYERQSMGNQFMINLMLMQMQLIDPNDKKITA